MKKRIDASEPSDNCKKIFFHSYKGGVGRTYLLANIAYELVKTNSKVGIIDLDYDAPGITNLILTSYGINVDYKNKDLIYLLINNTPAEIRECIITVKKKILILPTNPLPLPHNIDEFYKLILNSNSFITVLKSIIDTFIEIHKLDYLLFDLRPGFSFLIYPLSILADHVVQLFRLTSQDLYGTKLLLDALRARNENTSILVPTLIPMKLPKYEEKLTNIIENYFRINLNTKYFLPVINELYFDDTIIQINKSINKRTVENKKYLETMNFIIRRIKQRTN